jgi:hypothetical protein
LPVDRYLDQLDADEPDRREVSVADDAREIELIMPRTRCFTPTQVLRAYARRGPEIDRVWPASCLAVHPKNG